MLWLNDGNNIENAKVVQTYMIHNPCGATRCNSSCLKESQCSKFFPKKFRNSTTIDEVGYPLYRVRDMEKNEHKLNNANVVSYSNFFLMR